jgi:transposase
MLILYHILVVGVAMPFESTRARLILTDEDQRLVDRLSQSRSETVARVQRAQILQRFSHGETVSAIASALHTNRPKVDRCISKALELGVQAALKDLPGRGRRVSITDDDKVWVVNLACQKPKDLGYAQELWTTRLLAKHVRKHCADAGHSRLRNLARGTVSKILSEHPVKPHKIQYYLERRDPQFEPKMIQLLHVYKDVEMWRAIGNTAPDLPPVAGKHATVGRDHEYERFGTLSLLAGIDLLNGEVLGLVRERHRSAEFIEFLQLADQHYPSGARIRMVLDNHSAHISKQTRGYLKSKPNRFEFIFTPTHGSWLNLIESFFGKMTKTLLRGIRVHSKAELQARIELYLKEVNEEPVVFKWKYKLETLNTEGSVAPT